MRKVIAVIDMTDEQLLKHLQLSHGVNAGHPPLWEYPHMRYEDLILLDALHSTHHRVGSVLTCLATIDHEHEEI